MKKVSRIKPDESLIQTMYYNILARERERERERKKERKKERNKVRKKERDGEREKERERSLISVSLLLNKFKIDQESLILNSGQICSFCSIELKKLKLHGLWSFFFFNPLYNLS